MAKFGISSVSDEDFEDYCKVNGIALIKSSAESCQEFSCSKWENGCDLCHAPVDNKGEVAAKLRSRFGSCGCVLPV